MSASARGSLAQIPTLNLSIPNTVCGLRIDRLLAYETPKLVLIRNPTLGACYFFLAISIVCYIVGYQILYHNEHFQLFDVEGKVRVSLQEPTRDNCNPARDDCADDFTPVEQLAYCVQSGRPGPDSEEASAEQGLGVAGQVGSALRSLLRGGVEGGGAIWNVTGGRALWNATGGDRLLNATGIARIFGALDLPGGAGDDGEGGAAAAEQERRAEARRIVDATGPIEKKRCVYRDQHAMVPNPSGDTLFVPTKITFRSEKQCDDPEKKGSDCEKLYTLDGETQEYAAGPGRGKVVAKW
eukprot:g18783.t1